MMTRLTAMAIAMLLLMPFAFTRPLISIRLLGTRIDASLLNLADEPPGRSAHRQHGGVFAPSAPR